MKSIICRLQNTVRNLTPNEGENPTGIWRASAFRFTEETGEKIQMPRTENPYLYIVLDGTLRLYTPSGIMDYIPGQYSISKIDTPLSGTVLSFSDSRDFLSLSLKFTVNDVISSVLELDDDLTEKIVGEKMEENLSTAADQAVLQSVQKLFSAMQETVPSEFLRRAVMKEIIYYMYMLCGSCGRQLLQSVVNITQAEKSFCTDWSTA